MVESTSKGQLLSEADLVRIEKAHPDGLSSAQIIQIFQQRGVKLSEATFRKYVQLGLLPRCRRVGTKGKHRGSRGVYPCATVRRINSIKRLMERSYTIEEIQQSFSNFKSNIESVESALEEGNYLDAWTAAERWAKQLKGLDSADRLESVIETCKNDPEAKRPSIEYDEKLRIQLRSGVPAPKGPAPTLGPKLR